MRLMRTAAEAEEASDKHPVTPGNVAPSRELLGEMLLQLNRPAEAFAESERSLKRDPNRSAALPARAAQRRRQATAGRRNYYARLQAVAADHDSERAELAQSRSFLGSNDAGEPSPPSGTTRQAASPISRTRALRLPKRAVP